MIAKKKHLKQNCQKIYLATKIVPKWQRSENGMDGANNPRGGEKSELSA